MSITQVCEFTREHLLAQQRRTPLVDLKQRCRDIPRGRGWQLHIERAEEVPPILPDSKIPGYSSPLSTQPTAPLVRGPIPLIPELSRGVGRAGKGGIPPQDRPSAATVYGPWLEVRPPAMLVWTEISHFQGGMGDLRDLRLALDRIPEEKWAGKVGGKCGPVVPSELRLIRADMVVDPYQVFESHINLADGLLCFAEVLSREQLQELQGWSDELGISLGVVLSRVRDLPWCVEAGSHLLLIPSADPFHPVGRSNPLLPALRPYRPLLPPTATVLGWGKVRGTSEWDQCLQTGLGAVIDPTADVSVVRQHQE